MGSTRVSRVSSGVAPELSLHSSNLGASREKVVGWIFRRDTENHSLRGL